MAREAAQIGLGIVGAAIGAPFGMAGLGFSVGMGLGGMLIPQQLPPTEGPRLTDLGLTTASYGTPIPVLYGTLRVPGEIIFSTDRRERKHQEEVAGGKGSTSQVQTTYTYDVDIAYRFCEGVVGQVMQLFAFGKLFFDQSAGADLGTRVAGSDKYRSMAIYPGNETQLQDATIEAEVGAGNAPAWRGHCYVVLKRLELADYMNNPPAMTAVLTAGTLSQALTLAAESDVWDTDLTAYEYIYLADYLGSPYTVPVFFDSQWGGFTLTLWSDRWVTKNGERLLNYYVSDDNTGYFVQLADVGGYIYTRQKKTVPIVSAALPATPGCASWEHRAVAAGKVSAASRVQFADFDAGTVRDLQYPNTADYASLGGAAITSVNGLAIYGQWLYCLIGKTSGGVAKVLARYDLAADRWSGELTGSPFSTSYCCGIDENYFYFISATGAPGGKCYLHRFPHGNDTPTTYLVPSNVVSSAYANAQGVWPIENQVYIGIEALKIFDLVALTLTTLSSGVGDSAPTGGYRSAFRPGVFANTLNVSAIANTYKTQWATVGSVASAGEALEDILTDICTRHTSDFADPPLTSADLSFSGTGAITVDGYALMRQMTRRAAIEPLLTAYNIGMVESEGKIKFKLLTGAVDKTIDPDDLGAHPVGSSMPDPLKITVVDDKQLPLRVEVYYIDASRSYDQNVQVAQRRRAVTSAEQVLRVELSIAMTSTKARQLAEILLQCAWLRRKQYEFSLPDKYTELECLDVAQVTYQGVTHTILVMERDDQDGVIHYKGVADSAIIYSSVVTGANPSTTIAPSIPFIGPTVLQLIDCNTLRNTDSTPGYIAAVCGMTNDWHGAVLYKAIDNGETYNEAGSFTSGAVMGIATNALGDVASPNLFDRANTLTVRLLNDGALTSAVDTAALTNGANGALLGSNERGWEVIQYRDVVDNGDGTWTLSFLLRGRRGTESLTGGHVAGDSFIALSTSGMKYIDTSTAERGILRDFLAGSIGGDINDVPKKEFTWNGAGLKPLSVGFVRGTRAGADLTVSWLPRKRLNMTWRAQAPWATDENGVEQFSIDVMNGATVLNTYTVNDATNWAYTSAQQTADGVPSPSAINLEIYQISGNVSGLRGYVTEVTL